MLHGMSYDTPTVPPTCPSLQDYMVACSYFHCSSTVPSLDGDGAASSTTVDDWWDPMLHAETLLQAHPKIHPIGWPTSPVLAQEHQVEPAAVFEVMAGESLPSVLV
jgi:hypothetical protein